MSQQTTTQTGQTPQVPAQQASVMGSLTPILLMVLVFYFLIMRPQQKREAKRRDLVSAMKKGDRILTNGGIIGTLHKTVGEKEISVEIAENVRVRMLKNAVTEVLESTSELKEVVEEEEVKENIQGLPIPPKHRGRPRRK